MGSRLWAAFLVLGSELMNLFVYSDESGVFDYIHNDYFVFGGLVLLGTDAKNIAVRKYIAAEKALNTDHKYANDYELKATHISNKEKAKLFRSLNSYYKFAVVVRQQLINKHIFDEKKSKQRYLDYAYKIGLKKLFEHLISKGIITSDNIDNIIVNADEHTTATNGRYELREALIQEYKFGTFNKDWKIFYPPILPNISGLDMNYCNSAKKPLIRAADIIANRVYYYALNNKLDEIKYDHLVITILP